MRSVVSRSSVRCTGCQLPVRWCICAAHRTVECPLAVDVVMHPRERFRPSSTGNLIHRILANSGRHVCRRDARLEQSAVARPGREMWILHPSGQPAPTGVPPEAVQVVLLDGSWKEAAVMAQAVRGWGRLVTLPLAGESRYWLRSQADDSRASTVEALLYVLRHFGLEEIRAELERQFELHVYANLRARGHKQDALEYLATSPISSAFSELIAALDVSRPR